MNLMNMVTVKRTLHLLKGMQINEKNLFTPYLRVLHEMRYLLLYEYLIGTDDIMHIRLSLSFVNLQDWT